MHFCSAASLCCRGVWLQASSYWSQGRVQLWGGLLLCSLLFLAWDLKLGDLWEDWCLRRRQAARAQGRQFTPQENLDDVVTYMMKRLVGQGVSLPRPLQQQQTQQQQEAGGGAGGGEQLAGSPTWTADAVVQDSHERPADATKSHQDKVSGIEGTGTP